MRVQEAIDIASAEVGVFESPANSNNVKYNTWLYNRPVAGNQYPWCCAFVSWIFRNTSGLVKKTASCMDLAQWFRDNNRWTVRPEPGDIVFYKFGSNNRWTNHTGIVVAVNGSRITAIEGNTSATTAGSQANGGMVAKRIRSANIVGYGRPGYIDAKPIVDRPTLKKGSKGIFVKELQGLLNQRGARLDVDGIYGSDTEKAVKEYQGAHALLNDGVVGPLTWESLITI